MAEHFSGSEKVPFSKILYNFILQKDYKSGDKLPTERELSEHFGVGRSSVREALSGLKALGIIEVRQGSGCYVKEINLASLLLPIQGQLYNKRILVEEIMETRVAIELEIIRLAVKRATPIMLDKIESYLTSVEQDSAQHFAFEQLLAEMAGNRILIMMQSLVHELWRDITSKGWRRRSMEISHQEHLDIFRSIKNRDLPSALTKMENHLLWGVKYFDEMNDPTQS
ncbi:MAG: GntR family transcriptional regulator [Paenibacillus macerans]|uniref:Bacterial regulatory s, gntR family protein n=1 Tax=Paenibacillus macerans TaxID=44252 RepID=A0A090ZBB3_PAEMA|nr:GntR family transcriptional regulator [Paenibacillus macerans]KFN08559.1 bacterial regulatory s, gntR family protein [Paenibacillus macerans]MBS5913957.1 FadR family transcriptional regulator [Paenibacillus macerans]MCY7562370.1 GntR family transcriptional regulator [Paenibacillus macerans]MDU7475985.1 GntR family transcriptional regulator [Paenibacillus macerans]MEC0155004.1 GntR family transcriptional regulator [Paenibacillus macerans]